MPCADDRCFRCGTGHYCEPDQTPSQLTDTWDCPECGRHHYAFDPRTENLPAWVLARIPDGVLGWRSEGLA